MMFIYSETTFIRVILNMNELYEHSFNNSHSLYEHSENL